MPAEVICLCCRARTSEPVTTEPLALSSFARPGAMVFSDVAGELHVLPGPALERPICECTALAMPYLVCPACGHCGLHCHCLDALLGGV